MTGTEDIESLDILGLRAGEDWLVEIPLPGVAWLSGDSLRAHLRTEVGAASPSLVFATSPLAGQALLAPAPEMLTLSAGPTLTALAPRNYVYDVEMTRGGRVQTLFGGKLQVVAKVTRGA